MCKVSEATARRDLDEMAGMGYLERTHGGAVIERGTGLERGVDEKMKLMIPEKTKIAQKAAVFAPSLCYHRIGQIAEEMVRKLCVDIVFLGADAINPEYGVFDSNFIEIGIKRSIIASGRYRVLLSDHTKFRRKALTKVCDIDDFDVVITDAGIDEETVEILNDKAINLITI